MMDQDHEEPSGTEILKKIREEEKDGKQYHAFFAYDNGVISTKACMARRKSDLKIKIKVIEAESETRGNPVKVFLVFKGTILPLTVRQEVSF